MDSTKARIKCAYRHTRTLLMTWMISGYRHRAEITPFRVLWINPNQIIKETIPLPKKLRPYCHVKDGDWDLMEKCFEDDPIFTMLTAHFQSGVGWSEIAYYQKILETIKKNGVDWHGCRNEKDVSARCAYLDGLFNEIRNTGYRVPDGLRYGETGLAKTCTPREIAVSIGRDGEMIIEIGKHRLSMAKILALPLVPVRVMIRHQVWQELRDRVVTGKIRKMPAEQVQALVTHPDIAYLIKKPFNSNASNPARD